MVHSKGGVTEVVYFPVKCSDQIFICKCVILYNFGDFANSPEPFSVELWEGVSSDDMGVYIACQGDHVASLHML